MSGASRTLSRRTTRAGAPSEASEAQRAEAAFARFFDLWFDRVHQALRRDCGSEEDAARLATVRVMHRLTAAWMEGVPIDTLAALATELVRCEIERGPARARSRYDPEAVEETPPRGKH